MHHAVNLLKGGYSVAQTAMSVGYDDPFSFSKQFKKHIGEAPSRFKSSVNNKTEPEDSENEV